MQLLLIRHARNDWVGNRLAGWTPDVHLNDEGRAEALELAKRLHGYPIDAIYSSPLERALETAEYLAEPRGLAVQVADDLGEVKYGEWTGRTLDELKDEALWAQMLVNASGTRFPKGESLAEMQSRVVSVLDGIRAEHENGVAAAVAHGDVVKAAVAHYVGLHLDLFQRLVISTASLTIVRFTPHGPRLLCLNDRGVVQPPPAPADGDARGQSAAQSEEVR